MSLVDLLPTLCGLAGLPAPDNLDGVDWSGHLQDPASHPPPRTSVTSAFLSYGNRVGHGIRADGEPGSAWRMVRDKQWKYVEVRDADPLLFDLLTDPGEQVNLATDPAQRERCELMKQLAMDGFSWELTDKQITEDRERIKDFLSGEKPTTPNQYRLPDGRIFDAEASLYEARWLSTPADLTGGVIPQMFG